MSGKDSFASTVVVNFTIGKGRNKLNSNADGFGQQNLDHVAPMPEVWVISGRFKAIVLIFRKHHMER